MKGRHIRIQAARHDYSDIPVLARMSGAGDSRALGLRDVSSGDLVAAQTISRDDAFDVCWILDNLRVGDTREYEVVDEFPSSDTGVAVNDAGEGKLDITINGSFFTSYNYEGKDIVRPYLYPVIGPHDARVTRNYPMLKDVPGETADHRHHRSIWVAHGDVNGADDWSEEEGCARIIHRRLLELSSGPVFGRIRTLNDWVDNAGRKLLEEVRTVTVYNLHGSARMIDLDVVFRATEGDVKFGDTKEGGIVSVRVATTMDGNKGGTISNAFGGVTEAECWGWPAHWCDYSGPVEGCTVGISVFDNPRNFRYPTRWHVRDYGLFAANPFALSAYSGDPGIDGSHVVRKGELFPFSYRLYIHDGDAAVAQVGDKYHGYINAPTVTVE